MSYKKQAINDGDVITSTWGTKVEKGIYEAFSALEDLSIFKSGIDANGIYTVVTYKREDDTIYMTSTLSGGTSPQYTTRVEKYYDTNGTTQLKNCTFTISYDSNGNVLSEDGNITHIG